MGRHFSSLLAVLLLLVACDVRRGAATVEEKPAADAPAARAQAAPPPPSPRALPGPAAPPPTLALEELERVDLAAGLSTGEITIEVNDPTAQPNVPALVDGNLESLAKSEAINPLVLTVTLVEPVRLRAARVYLAASPYDWAIEPQPGEGRLVASSVPERAWSQIDLPEPTETSVVRLEMLRLERDDYVHANEIELYIEASLPPP